MARGPPARHMPPSGTLGAAFSLEENTMKISVPFLLVGVTAALSAATLLTLAAAGDASAQIAAEVLGTPADEAEEDATEAAAEADGDAPAVPAGGVDVAVDYEDDIRAYNAEGFPTYVIAEDGMVDWPTFSGYRRYHAECHVCHGPDGEGSSYAPALRRSVMTMDYYDFVGVVAGGRTRSGASGNSVMPAFGDNANVMCYVDDIYTYLRARGTGDIPRGRPAQRADKPDAYTENELACMGG
jgi:methanol metabolism-related c-type cytochrome